MSSSHLLTDLLHAASRAHGTRVAVEDGRRETLTYENLALLAADVAGALRAAGSGSGDRVGILAPKSLDSVVAVWGILLAEAAYVPVDSTSPPARVERILGAGEIGRVIASREWATRVGLPVLTELPSCGGTALVLTHDDRTKGAFEPPSACSPIAYVLYTSGSTGEPKGVVHTHASARSFIDWAVKAFAVTSEDRFASIAPFHFDLSVFDLFASAAVGGRLVLVDELLARSPRHLAAFASTSGVTVWYSTPTTIRLVIEHAQPDEWSPRLVLFAGEPFPPTPLRRARTRWSTSRWANLYGPTETNVCTAYELPPSWVGDSPPPIGRPCSYARVRVIGEDGCDAVQGTPGELWVSGESLMEGYWNRPDDDARAFVIDPAGTRWYRTGDQVRENEEGDLVFLGRSDRMIKRRGFRVELGEVEARLFEHPSIVEAAILALPDAEQGARLVACVRSTHPLSPLDLKRYCAEALPAYMIPDRFLSVAELPRTANDKIDYRLLATLV